MQLKYFSNLWWIKSMILVQMRPECWTSQGSLSCSPWQSVFHDWIATDATHKCRLGCEIILVSTGSWLVSICGFCLCGTRSWNSHVGWFFKSERTFEPTSETLSRGRSTNPLTWEVMGIYANTQFFVNLSQDTFIFDHLAFYWWKDTLKLNMFWELIWNRLQMWSLMEIALSHTNLN
jgi:hypothetical protein